MATYYLDLSLGVSSSGHTGTQEDPFSVIDWQSHSEGNNNYYVKGSFSDSSNSKTFFENDTYLRWESNFPWRITTPNNTVWLNAAIIDGGIIYSGSAYWHGSASSMLRNCFVVLRNNDWFVYRGSVYGSYIYRLGDGSGSGLRFEGTIQDSTIYSAEALNCDGDFGHQTWINCAFNKSIGGSNPPTLTNCITNWIPPNPPPFWDANPAQFSVTILLGSISTPPQPGTPPYTNYSTDLWGNTRTGIGNGLMGAVPTQSFYVDLSSVSNGHAGTSGDPFSFADWVDAPKSSTDTFYMKGSADISTTFNFNYARHTAWDIATNGPWRIRTSALLNLNGVNRAEYGIIETTNSGIITFSGSSTHSLYIIANNGTIDCSGGSSYGCLLKGNTINFGGSQYNNVVIVANSLTGGGPVFNNCALSFVTNAMVAGTCNNSQLTNTNNVNLTYNNCSAGWVPGTFPAWNALKENFLVTTMFGNLATPPQPGMLPYEDTSIIPNISYIMDFWGNPRTNIGIGYMPVLNEYWIDLGAISSGHAGTEIDPFSFSDWQTFITTTATGKIFYVKGSVSVSQTVLFNGNNGNHTYLAWSPLVNGPWKLNVSGNISLSTCNVQQGIINQTTGVHTVDNANLYTIYFKSENVTLGGLSNALGCTFVGSTSTYLSNSIFTDTVVSTINLTGGLVTANRCAIFFTTLNLENCIFNNCELSSIVEGSNQYNDCVIGHIGPEFFPAWNAPSSSFYEVYQAVKTPPQPGTIPYTGYATDLWGNERKGVGANYAIEGSQPKPPPFNPDRPGPSYCGVTIAGSGNADLILPKSSYLFSDVALPDMRHRRP